MPCLDDQRSTLLLLQHHLYYAPQFNFSSKFELWDPNTHCCSWKGVTCDALGHVVGIDLSNKNLSGSFHSIFRLRHLQRLNFARNNFNTTLLSYGFHKLQNLTHLNLSSSLEISYLTRLVSLDLSNQGSCYLRYYTILDPYYGRYNYYELHPELEQPLKLEKPNFKTLIKNLRFLTELYLDGVDISTQSAKWCETTSLVLSNLLVLSLSNCGMKGPLCSSLSRLSFLSKLILDGNPISYLPPNFLVNSSRLVSLSLIACNLNGHFPTGIHLLPKIQSIDISGNDQLMGQLPEFPANNALQSLLLYFTNFSGKLPEPIGNLKFLTDLDLYGCNFFGPILVNCKSYDNRSLTFPQLERLSLRLCNLTEFPEFIKRQDKLVELDLSNNHIHGFVPNWLWKSNLSWADLSFYMIDFPKQLLLNDANTFPIDLNFSFSLLRKLYLESCNISSFPEFLKSQENLEYLKLSNNKISGAIPNWVWKKSLRYLLLANNHLSTLDQLLPNQSSISSQDSLYFVASYNNLSGPIPNWLCNMSQLDSFDASYNNFNGPIPNCLGNMSALSWLGLQRNNFSGMLPKFLKATQLQFLKVSENRLVGKLPRSLAKCTQLMVLDVGSNMINDTFPFWLEKLTYLMVLILRENRFYGQIKHLKHKSVFPTLDALDIASNQFSGELSIDFLHATQLRSLKIGGNKLERKLSRSLANCTALEKLPSLKVLVLRVNRFYGTISKIDTEHGFLELRILDIGSNHFSGDLSIEFLQSLKEIMHLTNEDKAKLVYIGEDYYQDSVTIVNKGIEMFYQKQSGKIPPQLTSLTFLAALNLSYNQLEGNILQSNQFITFTNDSYRGNPKLWEDEDSWLYAMSTWKIELIGYANGFLVGLFIRYTVLNELGNKWVEKFKKCGKRNRRRCR
ncbi:hypothetical protein V6Z11_A02G026100 [Gossypium hirsutum]